jgi:hypothetical protein
VKQGFKERVSMVLGKQPHISDADRNKAFKHNYCCRTRSSKMLGETSRVSSPEEDKDKNPYNYMFGNEWVLSFM